jgi:phosphoribosylaminoimidazole-succinocarboxamide synthase
VYTIDDKLIMVVSDRISAFDHILPRAIPYKGQVLNQLAQYFLDATSDIVPNWSIANPHPNVTVGHKCEPIKLEMVIRGYLVGHALREYSAGKRSLCGVALPDGLSANQKLDRPIITPATKAEEGHDLDISKEEIIAQGIVSIDVYGQLERITHKLFERGQEMAHKRGLILVDTKYEFGIYDGDIMLIDEIHTPDSSRYFYKDEYDDRFNRGVAHNQLSKEFVREWLIEHNFMGKEGEVMPDMPDEFVNRVSDRYVRLYELLTGETFVKMPQENRNEEIEKAIKGFLNK